MTDSPLLSLKLDSTTPEPLFDQLYSQIRQRIADGRFGPGTRLTPSRKLAQELGLSRTTVTTAYDQLVAEGYVEARRGSGLYVLTGSAVELSPALPPARRAVDPSMAPPDTPKALHPGLPDMRLFPHQAWARCLARVARRSPEALTIAQDPFGDPELRAATARYLADWRGLAASPEQILITAGSVEGLELCLRATLGPGEALALEDPGFRPLLRFVSSLGLPHKLLPVGPDGPSLPPPHTDAGDPIRVTVLTPSSQFPLGGVLPSAQRLAFLQWAAANQGWIIEDDYDSEFRYAGRPIPAMASVDAADRTLYVGSFTKVFSTSLRLGFVVIPPKLIGHFRTVLRQHGSRASLVPQRPLAVFMQDGLFYRHIRKVRRIYGERRRHLLGLIQRHLSDLVDVTDHGAGMHLVLHLPEGREDSALAAQLHQAGVACQPLSPHYGGAVKRSGLLVGFCGFTPEEMDPAIAVLARVVSDV